MILESPSPTVYTGFSIDLGAIVACDVFCLICWLSMWHSCKKKDKVAFYCLSSTQCGCVWGGDDNQLRRLKRNVSKFLTHLQQPHKSNIPTETPIKVKMISSLQSSSSPHTPGEFIIQGRPHHWSPCSITYWPLGRKLAECLWFATPPLSGAKSWNEVNFGRL